MSATVFESLLCRVDNSALAPGDVFGNEPGERTGELAVRLGAS